MKWINTFLKKKKEPINAYEYMGSMGISPIQMLKYQESMMRIKEFSNE